MEAQQSHAPQVDTRPIETGEPENCAVEALEIDERKTPRPEPAETATPGKDTTRAIEIVHPPSKFRKQKRTRRKHKGNEAMRRKYRTVTRK